MIRVLLAITLLCVLAPGCGRGSAPLPPPPAGAKAQPWAAEGAKTPTGGVASFLLHFEDTSGAIAAASEIYMNVKDPYGRSAFNTTVKTTKDGTALFKEVPVGNYMLEFRDSSGRRSRLKVDLSQFTGANAGKDAGTANF